MDFSFKKYRFSLFIIITVISASCSTTSDLPKNKSYYIEDIDKYSIDTGFVFFPDTKVRIKTVHNSENIRIWIKAAEIYTAAGFLVNGLSVWIDPEAEKNKDVGVIYPAATFALLDRYFGIEKDNLIDFNDTLDRKSFNPDKFIAAIKKRGAVIQSEEQTRFAGEKEATIFLDDNEVINYMITLPFSFIGIENPDNFKVSIGVISKATAQPQPRQQQPSRTHGHPGDRRHPHSRQHQTRDTDKQKPPRLPSIDAWMIFEFGEMEKEL